MLSPCAVGGEVNGEILEGLLRVEVGKCPSEESIKYLSEGKTDPGLLTGKETDYLKAHWSLHLFILTGI